MPPPEESEGVLLLPGLTDVRNVECVQASRRASGVEGAQELQPKEGLGRGKDDQVEWWDTHPQLLATGHLHRDWHRSRIAGVLLDAEQLVVVPAFSVLGRGVAGSGAEAGGAGEGRGEAQWAAILC